MIDSLTIFSKSGAVLYHHAASDGSSSAPSSTVANGGGGDVGTRLSPREAERINSFVSAVLAGGEGFNPPGGGRKTVDLPGAAGGGGTGDVAEWETGASMEGVDPDWIAVSFVPSVVARSASSSRGKSASWMRRLLRSTLKEYSLYYAARSIGGGGGDDAEGEGAIADVEREMRPPDMATFDPVFAALLKRSEVMARRKESSGVGDGAPGHEDEEDEDLVSEDEEGEGDDDDGEDETDTQANIAKMKAKRGRAARGAATQSPQKKKGKEQRVWHDGTAKITKSALAKLDRSKDHKGESGIDAAVADDSRALAEARAAYLPEEGEIMAWEEEERLDDDDYEDAGADGEGDDQASAGWGGSLRGLFEQMSGNKVLTASDLDAPLTEMHRLLASKNVATDVASEICDGVRTRLVGKKLQSFGRVKTAVRHALEASIEKLLSPKKGKDVDMLKGVVGKRERQSGGLFTSKVDNPKPYVIVMVGINGVGKSTSLAKIAYYLKLSGCNPLIAACDTFRSGAVEQLNVHAKCLDVPLFHRGYAKDPSAVATAAIEHASEEGNDVVLIDTAGRMQNNVPLMRALGKLVSSCQPDLVLFVCEALVGNDGLDQLKMFDRAFRTGGHGRAIDGIVLTKFDTVSDKVGAALTLTHESGSPIAFVGTGQKYNHLKPLSVRAVIKSLFS